MRKTQFATGEFYHIFNRGTDKRVVRSNDNDLLRFLQSMKEFNTEKPIGSIFENQFGDKKAQSETPDTKLVEFICYCINSNHFHFIVKQNAENGVVKFMQRFGTGYTKYFNNKHKRSGVLFQGRYKSVLINSNKYLLHLSAYVNLNDRVHKIISNENGMPSSSWREYQGEVSGTCKKEVILSQFKNIKEYKKFAESSLQDILQRRGGDTGNCPIEYLLE